MRLKVYEFICYEPHANKQFKFEGYQMPSGQIMVAEEDDHYTFYSNLDSVEGQSGDEVEEYKFTGRTVRLSDRDIREAVKASANKLGIEAIPRSLRDLTIDRCRRLKEDAQEGSNQI